jgi:hypothetical protein
MATAEDDGIPLEKDELIQIVPGHKWGGCIAVVDESKSWGCQAYVTGPTPDNLAGEYYIRLNHNEFERLYVKAIFVPARDIDEEKESISS